MQFYIRYLKPGANISSSKLRYNPLLIYLIFYTLRVQKSLLEIYNSALNEKF